MRILYIPLLFFSIATYGQLLTGNKFIVIAHRGDHTQAPENTIKAYENAIKAGVDFIEVDLRMTKDDQLIIMHDEKIDRMTNGNGIVHELLWSEIKSLNVIDKNNPEWGSHVIPTFREVLSFCKNKVNIYLDFKKASVALAWKEIQAAGMEKNIVVYINSDDQYRQWRKLAPQIPLMVSLPKKIKSIEQVLDFLRDIDAEILDGSYLDYTIEKAETIHQSNRKIWADIQHPLENPMMWEKAIQLNVDGLQTDHPVQLIDYLRKKGMR